MGWSEKRFKMWALSAREHTETRQINLASLFSLATWDPEKFKDLTDQNQDSQTEEDKQDLRNQAIRRAEQIRRMPGSGSKLDPLRQDEDSPKVED